MTPLDAYLSTVAHELRALPPAKRDEELRELRSHLEQRVEDFINRGFSLETAQTQAIDEFGAARSLGIELCAVWEYGPLSTKSLLAATGRISLFWFCTTFELIVALYSSRIWPESVLFPELSFIVALAAFCIPLGCGWLWSNCIGPRGLLLLFFVVSLNTLFWCSVLAHINGRSLPLDEPFYDSILILNPFLAVAGAYLARALRHRSRCFSLPSGQTTSASLLHFPSNNKRRVYVGLALLASLGSWQHVTTTLHPKDPVNTLRTYLLVNNSPYGFYDILPPTIREVRALPAATPAEKAGHEARVSFLLESRANEKAAQWQANYLKTRLTQPGIHSPQLKNRIRQSIRTLQRNSHVVTGVARLVRTPDGWRVDESSFNRSQLWSWYYAATSPSSSPSEFAGLR